MDHQVICSWLGLPPEVWPPDHYRLLGLQPGEDNAELIEQRVHERLDTVRCYQMAHPEQATEAMNRLAQAFVCLTEPSSKKIYDAQLGIAAPLPPPETSPPPPAIEAPVPPPPQAQPIDWLPMPQPVRQPPPLPPIVEAEEAAAPPAALPMAIPVAAPMPVGPSLEPLDSVLESARSGPARRGIATKRGIYQRIALSRRLIQLWNDLGKYLESPKRRLSRSVDGPELVRLLDEIAELLERFPPLLGEAGQPGYLVLALTQVDTVKVFQSFSPHQREALSRDWSAGLKLLTAHRDFLRQELRNLRKRPWRQRLLHAGWSLIIERPGTVLLLLALLAINVALWRSFARELWQRLFSH